MVQLTQAQEDAIYNALIVGMAREDAYVLAGLDPTTIAAVSEDEMLQAMYSALIKQHEYSLLQRLDKVMDKQERGGKEGAVTWALEHMYPQRYANKSAGEGKTVNVVFNTPTTTPLCTDPADDTEVVEIHS